MVEQTHVVDLLTSNIFHRSGSLDVSMAGCILLELATIGRLQRNSANQIVLSETFRIFAFGERCMGSLFFLVGICDVFLLLLSFQYQFILSLTNDGYLVRIRAVSSLNLKAYLRTCLFPLTKVTTMCSIL